jgi:excisionase family DNA binding protein
VNEAPAKRVYTVAEAAELTGATVKAIRNRCDRGQLRTVKRGGIRLIPLTELQRAGLLEASVELEAIEATAEAGEARELVDHALLAELAKAHETIGTLRALTERSSSTEAELAAERRRREQLERELQEHELELERLRRRSLLERIRNR